jgi:predicted ATPase
MVKKADIDLRGLVVIAGENDTGKSTIGKMLFSVIRAFGKYKEEFEQDRHEFLVTRAERIYFELRSQIDLDKNEEIRQNFGENFGDEIDELVRDERIDELKVLLKNKIDIINQLKIEDEVKKSVISKLRQMFELSNVESNELEVKKQALNKVLASEYGQQIVNYYTQKDVLIKGMDGVNPIFSLKIQENEVQELEYYDELLYNEATYIESPYVLQMNDFPLPRHRGIGGFLLRRPLRSHSNYPFHVTDLLMQLHFKSNLDYSIADAISDEVKIAEELDGKISSIIGGSLQYQKKDREFIYRKVKDEKTIDIKLSNIATGIKAFGIIQMLLKADALHSRSLLIIDEPEVHLHPKWQIEYAELLVLLSMKVNVNILLTSHSPYFIEAIKVFSDKYDYAKKTKFYLAKKDKDTVSSTIINVTDNLEPIFEKLSEPFRRLEEESVGDL